MQTDRSIKKLAPLPIRLFSIHLILRSKVARCKRDSVRSFHDVRMRTYDTYIRMYRFERIFSVIYTNLRAIRAQCY